MACQTFTYNSLNETATEAASQIANRLRNLLAMPTTEKARLMVSGGNSPIPLFQRLSHHDIEWEKVIISLVDERWVPEDHVDSNTTLVRKYLLQEKAAAASFHPVYQTGASLAETVQQLNESFTPSTEVPTITVLGMGTDAHTASLFPDAIEYEEGINTEAAWLSVQPTAAPHARISMSLAHLRSSEHLFLFIPGSAKSQLLSKIQQGALPDSPVAVLLSKNRPDISAFCCPDAA